MSRAPEEFTLYDADNVAHSYIIVPHPASKALKLVWRLVQSAATPLARLITSADNLPKLIEALLEASEEGKEDLDVIELLKSLDLDFSQAATDFFTVVTATGEEWVTRELLEYTKRDGLSLKQKTRDGDFNFDQAYQANYGEMMEACIKAVQVNRFLSLFRSSFGSMLSLQAVAGGMDQSSTEQPGTSTSTG